jgi:hypothetical protein
MDMMMIIIIAMPMRSNDAGIEGSRTKLASLTPAGSSGATEIYPLKCC